MPIKFEKVSYTYSAKSPYEFQALKNITLAIDEHKIVAIVGETGSGKSTLIQHINGLLIPMTGKVSINDFVIQAGQRRIRNIKKIRKEVGLVFQFPEYQLFEETIERDIMFGPLNFGESKEKALALAKKYIKVVGLPESYLPRSPFDLSGGQKRRVAIAGILSLEGNTLILDEPTAGLDPEGESELIKLFYDLNKSKNKTIILVTHNMNHVLMMADEVIILHEGKFKIKGDPVSIFKDQVLMQETGIEPPKIYEFLHKLEEAGFDTSKINARNSEDLIEQLYSQIISKPKSKKPSKKEGEKDEN